MAASWGTAAHVATRSTSTLIVGLPYANAWEWASNAPASAVLRVKRAHAFSRARMQYCSVCTPQQEVFSHTPVTCSSSHVATWAVPCREVPMHS